MSSKKYRSAGYPVPRKTRTEIREIVRSFLELLRLEGWQTVPFPAVDLIEYWGSSTERGHPNVDIFADEELPDRDGEYVPHRNLFRIRESVYLRAVAGIPEAIESLIHEIGHALLDHPTPAYRRGYDPDEYIQVIPEEDSEHQANWCMDELNMPYDQIKARDSYGDLMQRFNVSEESAVRRVTDLIRERRKKGIS